ncbi:MAG: hypothetical protein ACLQPD_05950 [Desulfomonilaceae bacterium]
MIREFFATFLFTVLRFAPKFKAVPMLSRWNGSLGRSGGDIRPFRWDSIHLPAPGKMPVSCSTIRVCFKHGIDQCGALRSGWCKSSWNVIGLVPTMRAAMTAVGPTAPIRKMVMIAPFGILKEFITVPVRVIPSA